MLHAGMAVMLSEGRRRGEKAGECRGRKERECHFILRSGGDPFTEPHRERAMIARRARLIWTEA
jgi:hypothetical protein